MLRCGRNPQSATLTKIRDGKKVTLQYRTARDAFAPSKFVQVAGDGITLGLSLVWKFPPSETENEKVDQQEERSGFTG
jgi:hypothetical protein